ncbi:MAG: DUF1501 domain-containing protein [Sedimentisphaerales bacterium]|nr:DUF1501 domain-containing protein [Sedimentisphaerales bacterium]
MSYTRRDFLKKTAGTSLLVSFSATTPGLLVRTAKAAAAQPKKNDRILIVLQLSGGNDGLNTIVPYTDDEYARHRPTLRLPTNELHKIDSDLGFHPRMGALARIYQQGYLNIIQGVGYPDMDRNHDSAMRIWHNASPEKPDCQTGWLGRTVDSIMESREYLTPAVFVGPIARPFALNAQHTHIPSLQEPQDLTCQHVPVDSDYLPSYKKLADLPRSEKNDLLKFVQQTTSQTYIHNQKIQQAIHSFPRKSSYPSSSLAGDLCTIAQLIRADIGIRIYFVELGGGGIGGFDNHANQMGNHCALLQQLSEAVAAFVEDMKQAGLLDRVLLMTFSEFGRTLSENGRHGTGHGAAAPIFVTGGKVIPGLTGAHPSLTDLDNDALKFHTDFRQVYATALDRWLGIDSKIPLRKEFPPLEIMQSTSRI